MFIQRSKIFVFNNIFAMETKEWQDYNIYHFLHTTDVHLFLI